LLIITFFYFINVIGIVINSLGILLETSLRKLANKENQDIDSLGKEYYYIDMN